VQEARKSIDDVLHGDFAKNASHCRQRGGNAGRGGNAECEYASICRFRSDEAEKSEEDGEGNP